MTVRILVGDARQKLKDLADESAQACVTSPPFWRQRDYEADGQLGIERDPREYAERLVDIMREVRRVLVPSGVAFLELGDTYAAGGNGGGGSRAKKRRKLTSLQQRTGWRSPPSGYKNRDLSLSPFMVADMLRADGWVLRQTIIWNKGTATEPPRLERPSVSHSYVFLLAKGQRSDVRDPGEDWWHSSVWTIPPSRAKDGHPAPMAEELARRCILCATQPGDVVIDPFLGSGTTAVVAGRLNRDCVGIELNSIFATSAGRRIRSGLASVESDIPDNHDDAGPLFGSVAA